MAPSKKPPSDRGNSSSNSSRQNTSEPPRSSSSHSSSRQNSMRDKSSTNSSRQNTGHFPQEDSKRSLPKVAQTSSSNSSDDSSRQNTDGFSQEHSKRSLSKDAETGHGRSSSNSSRQTISGTLVEEYKQWLASPLPIASMPLTMAAMPPYARLRIQLDQRLSEGASMKDIIRDNNPGPGSLRFQDYGQSVPKTVPAPERLFEPKDKSKDWKKPLVVDSVMYHAGPKYRLDPEKTDMESARKNKNALVSGLEDQQTCFLRLQTIGEVRWGERVTYGHGFEANVKYNILHPDALIMLETKAKSSPKTLLIDQNASKPLYKSAADVKIGMSASLDQFYRDTMLKAICSKRGLVALGSEEHREKYRVTMLARHSPSAMQEVVTMENWHRLLEEMWSGAAWNLELFLIEITPAGKSGAWETFTTSFR